MSRFLVSPRFVSFTNCVKGVGCGFVVWMLMALVCKYVLDVAFLRSLKRPAVLLGPLVAYPVVLYGVLRFQLPPLSDRYIRAKWKLWIPGYIVAGLPLVDYLLLNRSLVALLTW